jgi:hypothetical protein
LIDAVGSVSDYAYFGAPEIQLADMGGKLTRILILSSMYTPEILADIDIVIIWRRKQALKASEIDVLERFVNSGGGLFITYEQYVSSRTMTDLSSRFGIDIAENRVLFDVTVPGTDIVHPANTTRRPVDACELQSPNELLLTNRRRNCCRRRKPDGASLVHTLIYRPEHKLW